MSLGSALVRLNSALTILVDAHDGLQKMKWWRSLPIPFLFTKFDPSAGRQALSVAHRLISDANKMVNVSGDDDRLVAEYALALDAAVASLSKIFDELSRKAQGHAYGLKAYNQDWAEYDAHCARYTEIGQRLNPIVEKYVGRSS